jgi:hypothetical protein
MTSMSILRSRADQLFSLGLTSHRAFGVLCREFPNAERDMLVIAAKLPGAWTGVNPWWSTWGRSLRPTQIRFQNKGAPRVQDVPVTVRTVGEESPAKPLTRAEQQLARSIEFAMKCIQEVDEMTTGAPTITVPVKDLVGGDWVEGSGEVAAVALLKSKLVYILFESGKTEFLRQDELRDVRLEDEKEEE